MLLSEISATIEALQTDHKVRTVPMLKTLKSYTHNHIPMMEAAYCTNDDYSFI